MNQDIEYLGQGAIFVLLFSFFLVIGVLGLLLWFGWWVSQKRGSLCPYSKKPMTLGIDIVPSIRCFVNDFISSHPQSDHSPIDFDRCAVCPETGRIFPESVNKGEIVKLDWSFLNKRLPGTFVSWGSLSELEQGSIKLCHETLAGFQVEKSSPSPLPKDIDSYYALMKPGPLYVERTTKVLLGWKEVPGTQFEVLIVQRPIYDSIDETL